MVPLAKPMTRMRPSGADALQRLIEQISADRIEDDISAAPAAELLELPAEIVAAVNQPGGGAWRLPDRRAPCCPQRR